MTALLLVPQSHIAGNQTSLITFTTFTTFTTMAASENTLSDLFNSWKGYGKELEAMIIDEEEEAEMDVTSDINNEVWIKVEQDWTQP